MKSLEYRPEIDGLRALAVVPVILFHAGTSWVSGGFVGVDVFFVISGYLITSIILSDIDKGHFSVVGFYERRARRILPALMLVTLCAIPLAYFTMLPYQLADFGQSIVAVNLFVSNILFWQESSYFAPDTALKPLLHTWSLAVEEQFYLIFPLVVVLSVRFGRTFLVALLVAGTIVSLVIAEIGWRSYESANFYLIPGRAWELLLGALAAMILRHMTPGVTPLTQALAIGGVVMIGGAVAGYDEGIPFPSVYTLLPCLGTVAVIVFAQKGSLAAALLSSAPLVGIGLISYSAYLWHQPVFAFAKLLLPAPAPAVFLWLSGLTLLLAILTWRFVERPFRDRTRVSRRMVFSASGVAGVALVGLGSVTAATDGFLFRYAPEDRYLASLNPGAQGRYIRRAFTSLEGAAFDADPTTRNVLIIGDSYAQDFVNMARESGHLARHSVSTVYIPAPCGIVLREGGHRDMIALADRPMCARTSALDDPGVQARLRAADIVILAASWRDWVIDALPTTLAALRTVTASPPIVISRKHFGTIDIPAYLEMTPVERAAVRATLRADVAAQTARLGTLVPPDTFVDIPARICDGAQSCPVFTPDGALISHDGTHLTPAGARYLGKILFDGGPLGRAEGS